MPDDDQHLQEVADFLLQRKLNEIDLTSQDIGDRLITLACGHIFTAETLDGHCQMSEYYEVDPMTGKFLSTKAPPINYQKPPTCPLCRGPITALRYGRVTKRATLDILEQNVASTMSDSLSSIGSRVQLLVSELPEVEKKVRNMPYTSGSTLSSQSPKAKTITERFASLSDDTGPLPANMLMQFKLISVHGFPADIASEWHKEMSSLNAQYREVVSLSNTRGPHLRSYEAALATLYRLELAAIAEDPSRATDAPEPLAMQEVNKKIGQPPHKADTRFQIEAYFLSLEIRYMIAQVAQSRLGNVARLDEDGHAHWRLWRDLLQFIYESCVRDARQALALAEASTASRMAARAHVHIIRADLEAFRFDIVCQRDDLSRAGRLDEAQRESLETRVTLNMTIAKAKLRDASTLYIRSRPAEDMEALVEERKWFSENCREKVDHYLEEYERLKAHIATDMYRPLSLQEKEDIVRAFGFGAGGGHAGHFYNCENGHTFVITEVSRLPDRLPTYTRAY